MNIDMINKIISKLGLTALRNTTLRIEERVIPASTDALQSFVAFGGEGWLLTAQRALPRTGTCFADCEGEWPEEGERCNGTRSLRMQRCPAGWILTVFEEADGTDMLVRKVRQLADGPEGTLLYEVYYRVENRENHKELRPFTCRFAGFEKGEPNHV